MTSVHPPPDGSRRRSAVALTVVLLALLGLGGYLLLGHGGAPMPPVQDLPPPAPADGAADRLTPSSEPPPPLKLVGEDYLTMVRSMEAYRDWAYEHPDPARLADIMDPRCPCLIEQRLLASYAEQGRWWTGPPTSVVGVTVLDEVASNVRTLRVEFEAQGSSHLIDATGAVHDTIAPARWVEENVYVRRSESSPWLLRSVLETDREPADDQS